MLGSVRLVGRIAVVVWALGTAGSAGAKVIASSGFSPSHNGFSFANYGSGYTNLSPEGMRQLFGDGVCASGSAAKDCVLTPVAQRYLEDANRTMGGGHCFGLSALSLLLFRNQFPPLAKTPVSHLKLKGNKQLQQAIAYTFQWQTLPALQTASVHGTPNDVLHFLINTLGRREAQLYTMAIFRPGFQGGHAITPYAVDSLGGGQYDVLVYDNNLPGQVRRVHFDSSADTWSYVATTNPSVPDSVYSGNAQTDTLYLLPTTPGLGVHFCPFCAEAVGRPNAYNELELQGNPDNHAQLLIRDPQGRALGYEGGKLIRQIPDASALFPTAFSDSKQRQEPTYRIPSGVNLQVTVDGADLRYPDTEHFSLIGQNHDLAIDGIVVQPDERESILLNGDDESMTYSSAGSQTMSPLFTVGLVRLAGNYSIGIQALSLHPDSVIRIADDRASSTLALHDASTSGQSFELHLTRQVDGKAETIRTARVEEPPGKTLDILYGTVPSGQSRFQLT